MVKTLHWIGPLFSVFLVGCGTDFNQALLLAGESGTRTLLDVLVSDLYSDLPDLFTLPADSGTPTADGDTPMDNNTPADDVDDTSAADDGAAGGSNGGGAPGGDSQPGGGTDLVGDAVIGGDLFAANFCAGCHCEDASGGCLPSAPSLIQVGFSIIEERLQGATDHPGGKFPDLSQQDIADLEAFFAGG